MKTRPRVLGNNGLWRNALLLATTTALATCGGGSGPGDGTAAGGGAVVTRSVVVVGPIEGLGSFVVNGIRFDDSVASVVVDGDAVPGAQALALGMMAEVRGRLGDGATSGIADSVFVFSELKGPVSGVDPVAGAFTALGVRIAVDSGTVFVDVPGMPALRPGDFVEVHGLRGADPLQMVATRVERKAPGSGGARIELRGPVAAHDPLAGRFSIGPIRFAYTDAALEGLPRSGLANGLNVRVRTDSAVVVDPLPAVRVRALDTLRPDDGALAELEGIVTRVVSLASFVVAGVEVDASGATLLRGSAAQLVPGARIEAEGRFDGGRLVASVLKFDDASEADELELRGAISDFAGASSFRVRGVAVDASGAVFERGSAAQLAPGRIVEIKGAMRAAVLRASRVRFEDL